MTEKQLITGGDPLEPINPPLKYMFGNADFLPAPTIQEIGESLIQECPEFEHLEHWIVKYAWKKEGGKKFGKMTLGTCTKTGGLVRFFGQCDFVVAIGADNCRGLVAWQLEALVYHELSHAGEKEEPAKEDGGDPIIVPTLIAHDAELFGAEIRRYGAWKSDLKMVGNAYDQAPLFDDEPVEMRRRRAS